MKPVQRKVIRPSARAPHAESPRQGSGGAEVVVGVSARVGAGVGTGMNTAEDVGVSARVDAGVVEVWLRCGCCAVEVWLRCG